MSLEAETQHHIFEQCIDPLLLTIHHAFIKSEDSFEPTVARPGVRSGALEDLSQYGNSHADYPGTFERDIGSSLQPSDHTLVESEKSFDSKLPKPEFKSGASEYSTQYGKGYIDDSCNFETDEGAHLLPSKGLYLKGVIFRCPRCGVEFARRDGLRHHQEKHSDRARPHKCKCSNCVYAGRYPKDLTRHELAHVKHKRAPFPCECTECGKLFTRREHLLRHLRHDHPELVADLAVTTPLAPPRRSRRMQNRSLEGSTLRRTTSGASATKASVEKSSKDDGVSRTVSVKPSVCNDILDNSAEFSYGTSNEHNAPELQATLSTALESDLVPPSCKLPTAQDSPSNMQGTQLDDDLAPSSRSATDEQPYQESVQLLDSAAVADIHDVETSDAETRHENQTGLAESPHYSFETLSATPESAGQLSTKRNPFVRRLRQLQAKLAHWDTDDSSDSDPDSDEISDSESDVCSDGNRITCNLTTVQDNAAVHEHTSTPCADGSDSTGGDPPKEQQPLHPNQQGSSRRTGGSSSTGQDHGIDHQGGNDKSGQRVQTGSHPSQQVRGCGTVILCPFCEGRDENMSNLVRKLKNEGHDTFYCNVCKSDLSPSGETRDTQSRIQRVKQWEDHQKTCGDHHCVVAKCAPPLSSSDLRHKHTKSCEGNRDVVKQADANYLYDILGVPRRMIEPGVKIGHWDQRRSVMKQVVALAEDASQQNFKLERERQERVRELDGLKVANRDLLDRNLQLENEKKELCSKQEELLSIIRHAMEDMERCGIIATGAFLDRVERHAPSALRMYPSVSNQPAQIATQFGHAPYTPSSTSYGGDGNTFRQPAVTAYSASQHVSSGSSRQQDQIDGSWSSGPPIKRRRLSMPLAEALLQPQPPHSSSQSSASMANSMSQITTNVYVPVGAPGGPQGQNVSDFSSKGVMSSRSLQSNYIPLRQTPATSMHGHNSMKCGPSNPVERPSPQQSDYGHGAMPGELQNMPSSQIQPDPTTGAEYPNNNDQQGYFLETPMDSIFFSDAWGLQ